MLLKRDLPDVVLDCLRHLGGSGTVVEVSREVWRRYEAELRDSGDLFYTWQYDLRWAAQTLRDKGGLLPTGRGKGSRWALPG